MRDLTEEELALAPEWATHYQFGVLGNLIFLSLRKMLAWNVNIPMSMTVDLDNCSYLICNPKPIPRKSFDITQHEWSDVDVSFVSTNGYTINIDVNDCGMNHELYLNKNDIIAAAKCLKLTAEDLK